MLCIGNVQTSNSSHNNLPVSFSKWFTFLRQTTKGIWVKVLQKAAFLFEDFETRPYLLCRENSLSSSMQTEQLEKGKQWQIPLKDMQR